MLFLDCPSQLLPIVKLVKAVVTFITTLVPIILIVVGTFDLLKAVTASKEDEIKAAQKLLIKRIIFAILIFLIVPLLNLIFGIFSDNTSETSYTDTWYQCWTSK